MGIDRESSKEYEKEWFEKIRFKGISQEELDKIAKQDKERKEAQPEIDRIVADTVNDPNCDAYDEQKIKKIEEEKRKKFKKIYSD